MKVFKYVVKNEDVRNLAGDEKTLQEVLAGLNPKENIIELDYSNVLDPVVSMSAGLIYQKILDSGFPKIIVKGHKNKVQLAESPMMKIMIKRNQLEIQ
jgi:hypothetical protein